MEIKDYAKIACESVEKHFGANVVGCKYLGGGSFGRVFRIDIDKAPYRVVQKIYLLSGMNEDECADLQLLSDATGDTVRFPKIYFLTSKKNGDNADALCMEFIEGVDCFTHFAFLFRSRKKKNAFAEAVTDAVLRIHSKTSDKFGYARNPEFDTWQAFYRTFVDDIITKARDFYQDGKVKKSIMNVAELAYRNFNSVFDEDIHFATLSHGDSNVMNMMADPASFELIAFIDPWNALYSDPDYDLYQLGTLTGNLFKLRKTYKSKAPTSPKCNLKVAYYGFMTELNCYTRTGRYTGFIMRGAIRSLKKEFRKYNLK